MRKLITTLLTLAALTVPLALASGASGQVASPRVPAIVGTGYWCDGNGSGSCKSLLPHATPSPRLAVYAIGRNAGAWRWDLVRFGHVGPHTFKDPGLENALDGATIYIIRLHASSHWCNGNSAGADVINACDQSPAQQWVSDANSGTAENGDLVNVGRSNDKDNWEILCNPGNVQPPPPLLDITTRNSCSNYHKHWAFVVTSNGTATA